MFALFFSLYYAMFTGSFRMLDLSDIKNATEGVVNSLGTFVTSIFNDNANTMDSLGTALTLTNGFGYQQLIAVVSLILALITSIGIVVMAVKGIKRVFGVFFMGIRR